MKSNNLDSFLREKLAETHSEQAEWERISKRVSFMNFFKFGLHHYNIYYTVAIVAGIAGIMSVFAMNTNFHLNKTYMAESKKINRIEKTNAPKTNSKSIAESGKYHKKTELSYTKPLNNNITTSLERIENIEAEKISSINQSTDYPDYQIEERISDNLLAMESKKSPLEIVNNNDLKESTKKKFITKRWSVEIYSQPVSSEALSLNIGQDATSFENLKTKQTFGLSLGVDLNNIRIQSGMQFSFYDKDFSNAFVINEVTQVKSYQVYKREIYGLESGKIVKTITDSVLVASEKIETKNFNINHINTYKFLQIPIMVGYVFRMQNFRIVAKTGLIFDFYKGAKGAIQTENRTVDLERISFYQSYFTSLSALSLYYKINPYVNLMLEPNIRIRLNSVQKVNDFNVENNKIAASLKIGFAFDF